MNDGLWVLVALLTMVAGLASGYWVGRTLAAAKLRADHLDELARRTQDLQKAGSELAASLAGAEAELRNQKETSAEQKVRLGDLEARRDELNRELTEALSEQQRLGTMLHEREEGHKDHLKVYQDAEERFAEKFDSLSAKALDANTGRLLVQAKAILDSYKDSAEGDLGKRKQEIDALVVPIQEQLAGLKEAQTKLEEARNQSVGELKQQLEDLGKQAVGVQHETLKLTKALQGSGQAGNWGEVILDRVLEMSGLQEGMNFKRQKTEKDEEKSQRPDITVLMPGGRTIVIDSKMPSSLYLDTQEDLDDVTRKQRLVAFAGHLDGHVKALSKREYSRREESADFTVLFLGSEAMYRAAVETRAGLIEDALNLNVVIATPTSLFAILKSVSYAWRQETLTQNAREVRDQGARLYETLCVLSEHYSKLGKALEGAGKAYNDFGRSLEARTLPAARKLKELGVGSSKDLPDTAVVELAAHALTKPELLSCEQPALPE